MIKTVEYCFGHTQSNPLIITKRLKRMVKGLTMCLEVSTVNGLIESLKRYLTNLILQFS